MKGWKLFGCILVFSGVALMTQSCGTSKGCGCGTDLNKVYRAKRFH